MPDAGMCGGSNRRSALLGLVAVLSALYHAGSTTCLVVLCVGVCFLYLCSRG